MGPPGPKGVKGEKGAPGSIDDMCKWLPKTMLKSYQENEEDGSFFITDRKKDVKISKTGEVITWFS